MDNSLYILDDHDEEWELDAECLLRICWTRNEIGGYVGAHDFED